MQHQGTAFYQVRSWSHLSQKRTKEPLVSMAANSELKKECVHATKRFQRLETTIDSIVHTFTYQYVYIYVCVCDLYIYIYIYI